MFGKEVSTAKVEDRKRRYEYTTEEADELRKQTGKNWSQIGKQLVPEESSNELSVEAEIGEFKESLTFKLNESERTSDDNPIFKQYILFET
ncbi:hypothetical protein A9G41_03180 [Gilliamella sp. Nev5-1]|uniref:hypothetical protein n=1 Tax=unclassified Gilliamella TaxID=2685620 RepID=UPI00080E2A67|nr:hypothetical protein [Gilliamella apicola]OCG61151.1 hypothetical protein A9G40_01535 [Gilliamella apicola]OCG71166.1 hypothetical protein A9G41_03180 [Gilliamella apicola]